LLVGVLEHYDGAIGKDPGLLDATAAVLANTDDATKRLKIARDRTLALAFLEQADRRRFGTLWADLENQFSQANNQYPIDLTAAYSLLVNFKPPKREEPRRNTRSQEAAVEEEDGMTFVQSCEVIAGADGVTHTGVTCFRWEHKGHYADKCLDSPNATLLQAEAAAAVTLLQASHTKVIVANDDNTNHGVSDFTFTQLPSRHELIPLSWVLLDSQSTVLVFKKKTQFPLEHPAQQQPVEGPHQWRHPDLVACWRHQEFWDCLVQSRLFGQHLLLPPFANCVASPWTRLLKLTDQS